MPSFLRNYALSKKLSYICYTVNSGSLAPRISSFFSALLSRSVSFLSAAQRRRPRSSVCMMQCRYRCPGPARLRSHYCTLPLGSIAGAAPSAPRQEPRMRPPPLPWLRADARGRAGGGGDGAEAAAAPLLPAGCGSERSGCSGCCRRLCRGWGHARGVWGCGACGGAVRGVRTARCGGSPQPGRGWARPGGSTAHLPPAGADVPVFVRVPG